MLTFQMVYDQGAIVYVDMDTFDYGVFRYVENGLFNKSKVDDLVFTLSSFEKNVFLHISNTNVTSFSLASSMDIYLGNVLLNTFKPPFVGNDTIHSSNTEGNGVIIGNNTLRVNNLIPTREQGVLFVNPVYVSDSTPGPGTHAELSEKRQINKDEYVFISQYEFIVNNNDDVDDDVDDVDDDDKLDDKDDDDDDDGSKKGDGNFDDVGNGKLDVFKGWSFYVVLLILLMISKEKSL